MPLENAEMPQEVSEMPQSNALHRERVDDHMTHI